MSLLATALITIKLLSSACFDPCTMTLTLTVEKAPDNSMVKLELIEANEEYYRSSELYWDGDTARTTKIRYIAIPKGFYFFKATLFKHDGKTWVAGEVQVPLKVIGEGEI